jgi:hypothetical protein
MADAVAGDEQAGGAPTPGSALAAPAQSGGTPDWSALVGSLPEDLRPSIEGTGVKDFAGFAKHYAATAQQVGKARIPSAEERAKWGDKERAAFYDQMGYPKEAKEYGLDEFRYGDLAEDASPTEKSGKAITDSMIERFGAFAAEHRMPREAARAAVEFYQKFSQDLDATRVASRTEALREIEKRHLGKYGGDEGFTKAKSLASAGAEAVFGERLSLFHDLEFADGTGVLDSAEIFDLLVETGRALQEGTMPASGAADAGTAGSVQEQINAFLADQDVQKALEDKSHPQHAEKVEERLRLYEKLRASKPRSLRDEVFSPQGLGPGGQRRGTL